MVLLIDNLKETFISHNPSIIRKGGQLIDNLSLWVKIKSGGGGTFGPKQVPSLIYVTLLGFQFYWKLHVNFLTNMNLNPKLEYSFKFIREKMRFFIISVSWGKWHLSFALYIFRQISLISSRVVNTISSSNRMDRTHISSLLLFRLQSRDEFYFWFLFSRGTNRFNQGIKVLNRMSQGDLGRSNKNGRQM
jgi:hypothetical protein